MRVDLSKVPPYSRPYFETVGDQNPIELMRKNGIDFLTFYQSIPADKWNFAYAEGKWTIKEVLAHVIDSERVFQYRALRFGRNDNTELPGFDQDTFAAAKNSAHRTEESLLEEYQIVRQSSCVLFENFNEEELNRTGKANDFEIMVGWIAYMIVGHEMHHEQILKERYL